MAMYLFKKKVSMHCSEGVNFREHLYVPEISEHTGEPQHEREDHNHVLKRIAGSLRKGHIPNVDVQAFVKAMHDPNTGLTYTALTGKRKQSVGDAEKLLSPAVGKWLRANSFLSEARFVEVVSNWHKASDGRGLSEAEREKNNLAMLDYLLEDWMPWFRDERDYSTLDVNRYCTMSISTCFHTVHVWCSTIYAMLGTVKLIKYNLFLNLDLFRELEDLPEKLWLH